jgi:hypothetical protein
VQGPFKELDKMVRRGQDENGLPDEEDELSRFDLDLEDKPEEKND